MIQFTHNDTEVGSRIYQAWVGQAQSLQGMPTAYRHQLTLARSRHPRNAVLRRAVRVGIGPKLFFVEGFCASHGYSSLACLAVNRTNLRPGPAHHGDWEAYRRAAAVFDWSMADAQLAACADVMRQGAVTLPAAQGAAGGRGLVRTPSSARIVLLAKSSCQRINRKSSTR